MYTSHHGFSYFIRNIILNILV